MTEIGVDSLHTVGLTDVGRNLKVATYMEENNSAACILDLDRVLKIEILPYHLFTCPTFLCDVGRNPSTRTSKIWKAILYPQVNNLIFAGERQSYYSYCSFSGVCIIAAQVTLSIGTVTSPWS
jgi:hypothetical protein